MKIKITRSLVITMLLILFIFIFTSKVFAIGTDTKLTTEVSTVSKTTMVEKENFTKTIISKIGKVNFKKAKQYKSKKQINLKWQGCKNAEYYSIYRKTKHNKWKLIKVTKKTNYRDKNIKYNKKYQYKIQATITVNNVKYSGPFSKVKSVKVKKPLSYSKEDLYVLSHIVYAEAGSNYCSDKEQQYVASVVLNRVASNKFPNTIKSVVFAPGQYSPTWNGSYYKTPNERAIKNAKYVLTHGSILPSKVVYQSTVPQGSGTYNKVGTQYFCY